MGTAWVLVFLITASGSSGGNALAMHDFHTYEACRYAGERVKKLPTYNFATMSYDCIPRQ